MTFCAASPMELTPKPSLRPALHVPLELHGRGEDLGSLSRALAEVRQARSPKVIVVTGAAGVGKSALVRAAFAGPQGKGLLRLEGKALAEPSPRPFGALLRAFRQAIRSESALQNAEAFAFAVQEARTLAGPIVDTMLPELTADWFAEGAPEAAPAQGVRDGAKSLFPQAFAMLLRAVASAETPRAICFDDLQWADEATLELLVAVLADPRPLPLLLVATCRNDDEPSRRALRLFLERLGTVRVEPTQLALGPLAPAGCAAYAAEALESDPATTRLLAEQLHARTGGNPLLVWQMLHESFDNGTLVFERQASQWRLEPSGLRTAEEDPLAFLRRSMAALDGKTAALLGRAACVGASFQAGFLADVFGVSSGEVRAALHEAAAATLLRLNGEEACFAHDRVLEVAHELLSPPEREEAHLAIGLALLGRGGRATTDHLFDAVDQLNLGAGCAPASLHEKLAAVNLRAALLARETGGCRSALVYARSGLAQLPGRPAEVSVNTRFELRLIIAHCLTSAGEHAEGEVHLTALEAEPLAPVQRARVYHLRCMALMARGAYAEAVRSGLAVLATMGVHLPSEPTQAQLEEHLGKVRDALAGRPPEVLLSLPLLDDETLEASFSVLSSLSLPAAAVDVRLMFLTAAWILKRSLWYGVSGATPLAAAFFGYALVAHSRAYDDAYAFGALAVQLMGRLAPERDHSLILNLFADFVSVWRRPLRESRELGREGVRAAERVADPILAGIHRTHLSFQPLLSGEPLGSAARIISAQLDLVRNAPVPYGLACHEWALRFVECLQARTPAELERFAASEQDSGLRARLEAEVTGGAAYARAFLAWAALLCGEPATALLHVREYATSDENNNVRPGYFLPDLELWHCVAAAWRWPQAPEAEKEGLVAQARQSAEVLAAWAAGCPENFAHKHHLAAAEVARLDGDAKQALKLYEEAAASARDGDFPHVEGLACERLADYLETLGLPALADAVWVRARDVYVRWEAHAKVAQLDLRRAAPLCPLLERRRSEAPVSCAALASAARAQALASVRAAQRIARSLAPEDVVEATLRLVLETVSATRAAFCTTSEAGLLLCATAAATSDEPRLDVRSPPSPLDGANLPLLVVRAASQGRALLLSGREPPAEFAADPYFSTSAPRTVLCLPLRAEEVVCGVLYLENARVADAFPADQREVLELVATQAALSLENAQRHADLLGAQARFAGTLQELQRVSSQMAEAEDNERRQLARDLHDAVGQGLWSVVHSLRGLTASAPRPEAVAAAVGEALAELERTSAEVRTVTFDLYPTMLDDLGLAAALRGHVARFAGSLEVSVEEQGTAPKLSPERAGFLFRAVKELLANTRKHARARGALVALRWGERGVRITVADDGCGFDPAAILSPGSAHGLGLINLRERTAHLGGRLSLESEPGVGTRAILEVPH